MNTYLHTLASGTVVHVDATTGRSLGPATPIPGGCPDLVEILSGHPEPDCEADRWDIVPCDAPAFEIPGNPNGWHCTNGHRHLGIEAEWPIDAMVEAFERTADRDFDPAEVAHVRDLVTR